MKTLLLSLALVAASASAGDLVLKNKASGQELRLLESQCSHGETLGVLKEEWRPKFHNARILSASGAIQFYGCWLLQDDGTVVVILSDGATMAFEASAFADPSI